ncbi:MAG: YihY/virulence factor BrkB family protein [Nitrospiraceae bacterium]
MSDFRRHGCTSLAASLAFFALLSFFPIVFLLLHGVSFFMRLDQLGSEQLVNFLQGFLPSLGEDIAVEMERVAEEQVSHVVVFLTFVWFGLQVFYEVDYAVNVVFEVPRQRNPLITTAISIGLLGLVGALFILSYLVTQILDLLVLYAPGFGGMSPLAIAANEFLLSYSLPFLLVLAAVTCLYRYVPRSRPRWGDAAVGGLVLALLWEGAKHLFSTYVPSLTVYSRMYGSLLVVVLFLLWVYYSAVLLLFSAAIVHRLQVLRQPSMSP